LPGVRVPGCRCSGEVVGWCGRALRGARVQGCGVSLVKKKVGNLVLGGIGKRGSALSLGVDCGAGLRGHTLEQRGAVMVTVSFFFLDGQGEAKPFAVARLCRSRLACPAHTVLWSSAQSQSEWRIYLLCSTRRRARPPLSSPSLPPKRLNKHSTSDP